MMISPNNIREHLGPTALAVLRPCFHVFAVDNGFVVHHLEVTQETAIPFYEPPVKSKGPREAPQTMLFPRWRTTFCKDADAAIDLIDGSMQAARQLLAQDHGPLRAASPFTDCFGSVPWPPGGGA